MSIESRPPQEAEQQNTAEMISPTANPHPADQAPASISPTGQPGGRRKMGKTGPPGPAMKGRSAAKRKPEKKRPAPAKKAAPAKNTRAGEASSFRKKEGWKTEPKVGGRKPSADQKRSPTKKSAPAKKAAARRATGKSAAPARAPAAKRGAAKTAAKRPAAKRTTRR